MSTGLAWQIPYEHLDEFAFVFRQLIFEVRSSKTVYKYFSWYYSIQNEFEEDKRFTNEEYLSVDYNRKEINEKPSELIEVLAKKC